MGDRLGIPGAVGILWMCVLRSHFCVSYITFYFLEDRTDKILVAVHAYPHCLRPYHVEHTGSRPITEVKQHRAWLVLGWVTA